MIAPDLINVEVISVLRRMERQDAISGYRAVQAIDDLRDAPLTRIPTRPLIERIWAYRANVSAYDATYVALAEVLDCDLVTADGRLSRVPGLSIRMIVV
jgi:predicted nucleic acid-binding protein